MSQTLILWWQLIAGGGRAGRHLMRLFLGLNEGTSGDERQKAPRVGFDLLSRTGDQPNWMNQAHKARVFYSNWAHKESEQIYLHQMLCVIAFQMCLTFFPPFAAGDKIIQIGEGGGKKYIFVVSTLRHSLQRLHPLQLAKQTTSISANLLFFMPETTEWWQDDG